jgi:hypothetical protein
MSRVFNLSIKKSQEKQCIMLHLDFHIAGWQTGRALDKMMKTI